MCSATVDDACHCPDESHTYSSSCCGKKVWPGEAARKANRAYSSGVKAIGAVAALICRAAVSTLLVHRGQPRPGIEGFHHAKPVTLQVRPRHCYQIGFVLDQPDEGSVTCPLVTFANGVLIGKFHVLIPR
jgi:hypothetical protein